MESQLLGSTGPAVTFIPLPPNLKDKPLILNNSGCTSLKVPEVYLIACVKLCGVWIASVVVLVFCVCSILIFEGQCLGIVLADQELIAYIRLAIPQNIGFFLLLRPECWGYPDSSMSHWNHSFKGYGNNVPYIIQIYFSSLLFSFYFWDRVST